MSTLSHGDGHAAIGTLVLLLQKRRRSRKAKVQPKVQVESAVVEQATGKAPVTPLGQAETTYLQVGQ